MPARFRRHWFVANLSPISEKALAGIFAPLVEAGPRSAPAQRHFLYPLGLSNLLSAHTQTVSDTHTRC